MEIVLASASERRSQLLRQLLIPHQVQPVCINEGVLDGEPINEYVKRMARGKALAAKTTSKHDILILGADTAIEINGEVIGKPANEFDAMATLRRLSGHSHNVFSGVCALYGERSAYVESKTRVQFRELSELDIVGYVSTGEPLGKAGSYAIQGFAAMFVENINGSYSGVMGLPLFETAGLLEQFGYCILRDSKE